MKSCEYETMKRATFVMLLLVLFVASSTLIFAAPIQATLSYGNVDLSDVHSGATSVGSFVLETDRPNIAIVTSRGDILTKKIVFTNSNPYNGFYYQQRGNRLAQIESDELTIRINRIEYTLMLSELSELTDEIIQSLQDVGISEGSVYIFGTDTENAISMERMQFSLIIMLDDGSVVAVQKPDGSFEAISLPAALSFSAPPTEEAREIAEERVIDISSTEVEAPEGSVEGCNDNDMGMNFTQASYATQIENGRMKAVTDFCASGTRLYEAYCEGNRVRLVEHDCEHCVAGACTEAPTRRVCYDTDPLSSSTALRDTFSTKGVTLGFYATAGGAKEFGAWDDYCKTQKTLVEYYCVGDVAVSNVAVFREVICPNGCSGGLCQDPPYCFDTDGGNMPYVKGTIRGINASEQFYTKVDTCKDGNTVIEYYCNEDETNSGYSVVEIPCGEGKVCRDGKCVSITQPAACDVCDEKNPFNIKKCVDESTKRLLRCEKGSYCSGSACVEESLTTMDEVRAALERREKWAKLLDDTLKWIESREARLPTETFDFTSSFEDISRGFTNIGEILEGTTLPSEETEVAQGPLEGGLTPPPQIPTPKTPSGIQGILNILGRR